MDHLNGVIKYSEREVVFDCWPMWYHKVCICNIYLYLSQVSNVRLLDRQGWLLHRGGNQSTPHRNPQQGRPLNIQTFGNVDLNKLYSHCTPERHWQTVIVNAESVSHLKGKDTSSQLLNAQRYSYCERFFQPHAAKRVRKLKGPFSLLTSKALGTYSCLHFPVIISNYSLQFVDLANSGR